MYCDVPYCMEVLIGEVQLTGLVKFSFQQSFAIHKLPSVSVDA